MTHQLRITDVLNVHTFLLQSKDESLSCLVLQKGTQTGSFVFMYKLYVTAPRQAKTAGKQERGVWPTGKQWQRHQRPPLVAARASASRVLLIRPCKHPGKTFEEWPNSNSNCPYPLLSLSPLSLFASVSLVLNAVPDSGSPTVWVSAKQFAE